MFSWSSVWFWTLVACLGLGSNYEVQVLDGQFFGLCVAVGVIIVGLVQWFVGGMWGEFVEEYCQPKVEEYCQKILDLVSTKLLPKATDVEPRVFYHKMKGDYFLYQYRATVEKELNDWISWLLRDEGVDLFRSKGVHAVQGIKKFVFQAIRMLFANCKCFVVWCNLMEGMDFSDVTQDELDGSDDRDSILADLDEEVVVDTDEEEAAAAAFPLAVLDCAEPVEC